MNSTGNILYERLIARASGFHKVIDFNPDKEKLVRLDLTSANPDLAAIDVTDTAAFSEYINSILKKKKARYGIGGYKELRDLYSRSELFSIKSSFVKESF